MEQFTVPQFIDEEDKILGPITTRQFIILLVTAGIIFVEYKIFDFSLFVVSGLITAGVAVALAFGKINGRPFHFLTRKIITSEFNKRCFIVICIKRFSLFHTFIPSKRFTY